MFVKKRQEEAILKRTEGAQMLENQVAGLDNRVLILRRCVDQYNHEEAFAELERLGWQMFLSEEQRVAVKTAAQFGSATALWFLGKASTGICVLEKNWFFEYLRFLLACVLFVRLDFWVLFRTFHLNLNPLSLLCIGFCLLRGVFGFSRDAGKGYEHAKKAADKGHSFACFDVGMYLLHSSGESHVDEALEWFQTGMERGCTYCHQELGNIFKEGQFVARDFHKAALFYHYGGNMGDQVCISLEIQLRRSRPREVVPWCQWSPPGHFLCTPELKTVIFVWLCTCKRYQISKDVALKVCVLIVTRDGWSEGKL